ncbi:MAG: OmpA family protein [Myxococcales bacterium]|nr:OmpA family protein [Myxococcales bacterium]
MSRVRVARALLALVTTMLMVAAGRAHAQPRFDPQLFHPSLSQRSNAAGVSSADLLENGSFELGLLAHYDTRPLVMRSADGSRLYAIIDQQASLHLLGAVGIAGRLELGLDIPVIVMQRGDTIPTLPNFDVGAPDAGAGPGEARLGLKLRLFNTHTEDSPGGAAMALVVEGFFPTGEQDDYQGEGFRIASRLVVDGITSTGHRVSLSAGYTYRSDLETAGLSVGGTVDWGLAIQFRSRYVHVVPEVRGSIVVAADDFSYEEAPTEAMLNFRFLPIEQVMIQAGGGVGLFQGFGAPDYRILFGLSYMRVPDRDRDGDGILNRVDACPEVPEDADGFEDEDGCPDLDNDQDGIADEPDECPNDPEDADGFEDEDGCADPDNDQDGVLDPDDSCPLEREDRDSFQDEDGCPDRDNDGDGIQDISDQCANEPEDQDGFQDTDGCPDPDNDQDRILDGVDRCPNEAEDYNGVEDEDGCPEVDTDGDGLLDPHDACPHEPEDRDRFQDEDGCPDLDNDGDGIPDTADRCPMQPEVVNGFEDTDGCPDQTVIHVTCASIEIRDHIHFESNRAVIQHRSFDLLNQLAGVIVSRPDLRRVSIEGHTDSRGRDRHNLVLSQQRAASVREYLIQHGVAPERLQSEGYGETRPIDDNNTPVGRAANRRVEFVILEQDGCRDN